jgi:hypothetical protein
MTIKISYLEASKQYKISFTFLNGCNINIKLSKHQFGVLKDRINLMEIK